MLSETGEGMSENDNTPRVVTLHLTLDQSDAQLLARALTYYYKIIGPIVWMSDDENSSWILALAKIQKALGDE